MCQREEKVLPCEIRHWPSRGIRANDPNKWETEISLRLNKIPKQQKKLLCTGKSLSECARCQEDTSGAGCLSLKTIGKLKRFRSNAGGIVWQGKGRRLLASSDVPHGVREGLEERVAIFDTRIREIPAVWR